MGRLPLPARRRRAAAAAATPPHPVLPSISAARGGRAAWNPESCGAPRPSWQRGLRAASPKTHVGLWLSQAAPPTLLQLTRARSASGHEKRRPPPPLFLLRPVCWSCSRSRRKEEGACSEEKDAEREREGICSDSLCSRGGEMKRRRGGGECPLRSRGFHLCNVCT